MRLVEVNRHIADRCGQGTPHNIGIKEKIKEAMQHPDKLGAGAKKRKHLKGQEKVHVVIKEFKRGTLHSGSGKIVKNRKQAIAIAMSEAGLSKNK
jgi:hypothetical protein